MSMIKNKDLTFLVQGPICKINNKDKTFELLKNLALHFLDSNIIFSTWNSEDTSVYKDFNLINNDDPGSVIYNFKSGVKNNLNRQIGSNRNTLKFVKTKYCMKVRSDLFVKNSNLLSVLNNRPKKVNSKLSFTKEYVIVIDFTTANPKRKYKLPHHPCDWIYAGQTEDLIDVWDIPLERSLNLLFFKESDYNYPTRGYISRYRNEAYIWKSYLEKYIELNFKNSYDNLIENVLLTDLIFLNNLMIVSLDQIGFGSNKYKINYRKDRVMYDYIDWRKMLKKSAIFPGKKIKFKSFVQNHIYEIIAKMRS
jgi:hypothetical protein